VDGFDAVRAMVRWVHAIAAVAWVGGSIFYLVVLRPALVNNAVSNKALETAVNKGFRDVVDLSIIGVITSGAFITFDRLASSPLPTSYFILLALKVTTVLAMLFMARSLGTRLGRFLGTTRPALQASGEPSIQDSIADGTLRKWLSPARLVLLLGLVAFFLSMLLGIIFENSSSAIS